MQVSVEGITMQMFAEGVTMQSSVEKNDNVRPRPKDKKISALQTKVLLPKGCPQSIALWRMSVSLSFMKNFFK